MNLLIGRRRILAGLAIFVSVFILGIGVASAEKRSTAQQPSSSSWRAQVAGQPTDYVGQDVCAGCHEDKAKQVSTTVHAHTVLAGASYDTGCETCHGPGKAHADAMGEAIGNAAKVEAAKKLIYGFHGKGEENSARCLACHEYGEEHSNFARSQHNVNDVACIDCHSAHHAKESQFLLVERQPVLCFSCHTEIKPEFSKPFHHRVNEGLVRCTDCHNQHGGFLTKQLRSTASQDQVCFKCHVEKAGPFVFEHPPVKTEGCVACHTPHGSSNPRLLRRSQVNLLCLECHTLTVDTSVPGLPSFHNQAAKYQACTMCHTQIHGSNFSNIFFK
ncbi:MAG: DmsE family decaheme c-type cytochrome [Acidobacteriia bacterium]|nr:DmsE family decaheme c-type cytochrome [Terriglobia bacterium]